MATLSIQLNSVQLNATKTYNVPENDVTTLIAWAQQEFPRGDSSVTPTPQQALLAWVQDWINRTTALVQSDNTTHDVPPPLGFS